ncbi:hypothetical protein BGZ46_004463 [Entomortierella lignicola]|nr:hypothetical protein BGZ46_004463 [Entomortierella lignicola]
MSSYNPEDPFDNGQPWQNVTSHSTWSGNNLTSAAAEGETHIPEAPVTQQLVQPTAPMPPNHTAIPTAVLQSPVSVATTSQGTSASEVRNTNANTVESTLFDDLPPSYEAAIIRDRPQIHDNYDHLRGPVGQRGVDIKTRIPLDSTPSSHYQSGGSGSGSNSGGVGSSSRPEASENPGARYGSISPPQSTSSRLNNIAQPSAPNILHGQVSQGREDDELHSRDVDRLLGPSSDGHEFEEPESGWGIVGSGKAWLGLAYLIFILFPWSLFCFIWTLVTGIISAITMIVPPIGYLFLIATITSWRALARVDLVISKSLVSWQVSEKYPHAQARIFVALPESSQSLQSTRRSRSRRSKNLWQRGSEHLKATLCNKHTFGSMSYFLIWKFIFALVLFPIILLFIVVAIPFMVCLLPSLLAFARMLINWQFRWAVFWLAEKKQPIALP